MFYRYFLIKVLFLVSLVNIYSKTITIKSNNWNDYNLKKIVKVRDNQSNNIGLSIDYNEYNYKDKNIDLLLHFNDKKEDLKINSKYIIENYNAKIDNFNKRLGSGSAKFYTANSGITLRYNKNSIFHSNHNITSFTIEFWLNPAVLHENDIIFKKHGIILSDNDVVGYKGIICSVNNMKLNWYFEDMFNLPEVVKLQGRYNNINYLNSVKSKINFKKYNFKLLGNKSVPINEWSHHALTFDFKKSELIYYLNGKPDSNLIVESNGVKLSPSFSSYNDTESLVIGSDYIGYIDEFMIYKSMKKSYLFDRALNIKKDNNYNNIFDINRKYFKKGRICSKVYDLGYKFSNIENFSTNTTLKYDSDFNINVRMSNSNFNEDNNTIPWYMLTKDNLSEISNNLKGRYFQWCGDLSSSFYGAYSPIIRDIEFSIHNNTLPIKPVGLKHIKLKDGRVMLYWKPIIDSNIQYYKLYYTTNRDELFNNRQFKIVKLNSLTNVYTPYTVIMLPKKGLFYYFNITATDIYGIEGKYSDTLYFKY